jgi:protocatechuate 3,4-dioxygenase beta subunit
VSWRAGRKEAGLLAVAAVGLGGFIWWATRDEDDARQPTDPTPAAAAPDDSAAADAPPTPRRIDGQRDTVWPQPGPATLQDDPLGSLQLEGQVVDTLGRPVGGAVVTVDARPFRTTTSEADGSFVFSALVARRYHLAARAGDSVGGPVQHDLAVASPPIVLRVREGATVDIAVVGEGTGAPVVGARVTLWGILEDTTRTEDAGTASFRGVASGSHMVKASADGYAPRTRWVEVADRSGVRSTHRIELARGAEVAGRVVDAAGHPVAGATVAAQDAAALVPALDPRRDHATTDAAGQFRLPTLASGTYRFHATHERHAPAASDPIYVDGTHSLRALTITLPAAARLAGTVLTAGGDVAAWATVRVGAPGVAGQAPGPVREAVADERGHFAMTGLARESVLVVARTETASSAAVAVDLADAPTVEDLVLRLEVTGALGGMVVDENGEPIAEAQVTATPDVYAGAAVEDWNVRGFTARSTDGGGRFAFRGLAGEKYRLRAARGSLGEDKAWLRAGLAVNVGQENVRLVLESDGRIRGRLAFADGSAPAVFSITLGWAAPLPSTTSDGSFATEVPAGRYDVRFRGPGFAERVVRDVKIEPGKATDVGILTVERGRTVSGQVIDGAGAPVAAADVVFGPSLFADGARLGGNFGAPLDERLGLRRATSDAHGAFHLGGIGDGAGFLAAEHDERGRSAAAEVARGSGDVTVTLTLVAFGSLAGKVTGGGAPGAGATVVATPVGAQTPTVAQAGADGRYHFERLPAGGYQVRALLAAPGMAGGASASAQATVAPGAQALLDLDVTLGDVTLLVTVEPEGKAKVDAAQVFLLEGQVAFQTAKELNEGVLAKGLGGNVRQTFAFAAAPARFPQLVPATYTVCILPITGDLNDPSFGRRLQEHAEQLTVHCKPAEVRSVPAEQRLIARVPAMPPMPP